MSALLDTALPPEAIGDVVFSVNAFVSGVARLEIDPALGRGAAGYVGPILDPEMVQRYGQPERYPALMAILTAGAGGDPGTRTVAGGVFEFGLGKLLDGIAAYLA